MKNFKWIILFLLLLTFSFIAYELSIDNLSGFDTSVYSFIIGFKCLFLTYFFRMVTFLSSSFVLIVISIFLFFIFKNKKYALLSLYNLIFIALANQGLKLLFSRERPEDLMMVNEAGFSFPSGHAMVSLAFYGMLIYLIWKTDIDKKYKKILTFVLSLLVLLIGISRIYLGVHFASDIVAGFTLSISYLIIVTSLINYYLEKNK